MADKQTLQYLKEAAVLRAKAKTELEEHTKELMKQITTDFDNWLGLVI